MYSILRIFFTAMIIGLLAASASTLYAQEDLENAHVTIENPADLTKQQALDIYKLLKDQMAENYALSRQEEIKNYQSWTLYNSAPYLSATHGQRFVNNYANQIGKDYGTLKDGQFYPEGTVLAKDSITITDDGKTFMGAMFVMEKMAKGVSPKTADWRYTMVIPDGTLFGDTLGSEPELVKYCHACHKAKAKRDFIFFVPEDFRIKP